MTDPQKRRPILDIVHDINTILDANFGEVSTQIEAALDALELELEDKVEAYSVVLREKKERKAAFNTLKHYYTARAAFAENDIQRLETRLAMALALANQDHVRTKTAHVFFRTDKAVEVDETNFVSAYRGLRDDLLRYHEPEPNKTEIKRALERGEPLEHVTMAAHRSLQIK